MRKMTMRERMLAVMQGREHDRVPFAQYEYVGMGPDTREEAWALLGPGNIGFMRLSGLYLMEAPNCRSESEPIEREGVPGTRTTMHTPAGQLYQEVFYEPVYHSASTKKHYVKEPEDYEIFLSYLRDVVVREDIDRVLRDQKELGEDGLPHVFVPRTPYQQLWVEWVSLMDLGLHLVDCPDLVQECASLMTKHLRQIFEIVRKAPIPYVVFPDNITAPAIGEKYFRQYCVPLYNELADMLADKKVPVLVHMDGDLKPLWKAISDTKIGGIDSLSPPPHNDTSVAEAARMWPHMNLLVNFPSPVHLQEPNTIYQCAEQILAEGGHTGRLQIQISENVPPGVWRTSFPEIVKAIEAYGKPGR